MTLTTQSESVPLVEAMRFTIGCPLILTGSVNTSETKTATSGRPEASRWSSTSQRDQLVLSIGRARYGTGLAGSEMYSSYSPSPDFGARKLSFDPAFR